MKVKKFINAQKRVNADIFRQKPDSLSCLSVGYRFAENPDASGCGAYKIEDDFDECAFACAVGPEKPKYFSPIHNECYIVERRNAAVFFYKAVSFDCKLHMVYTKEP